MQERLSTLKLKLSTQPAALKSWLSAPVLVWEAAPPPKMTKELLWNTQGGIVIPKGNDPLLLKVGKRQPNAFGIGITVGRTANNDLELDNASVSRFHAFFQRDEHTGVWHVVDAESFNGTSLEGTRLAPGRPAPLVDGEELRFGSVETRFFLGAGFEAFVRSR